MKKLFWGIVFLVYILLANLLLFYVSSTTANTFSNTWVILTNVLIAFVGAFVYRLPQILERMRGEKGKRSLDLSMLILGLASLFVALSEVWMYTIFAWLPVNDFFNSLFGSYFLQSICSFAAGLFFIDCVKKK